MIVFQTQLDSQVCAKCLARHGRVICDAKDLPPNHGVLPNGRGRCFVIKESEIINVKDKKEN